MSALFVRRMAVGALGMAALCTLTVASALALGAARPAPDMRAVLGAAPCTPPCWHDITPGVTPLMDAVRAIYEDPALEDLSVNVRSASWWWNGEQPAGLSHRPRPFDGRMIFRNNSPDGLVDGLALMTALTLGDLIGALGPPDRHILYFPPTSNRLGAIYAAEYAELTLFTTLHCPAAPGAFWSSEAGVIFGEVTLDMGGQRRMARSGPGWPIQMLQAYCEG